MKTKLLQSEGKEEVWLEVTNTSGYPMDFTKEDIIERFARGDKARTGDGNGLGLAIVGTYAKALGGEFDILIDCDQFKACLKFPKRQHNFDYYAEECRKSKKSPVSYVSILLYDDSGNFLLFTRSADSPSPGLSKILSAAYNFGTCFLELPAIVYGLCIYSR